MHFLEDLGVKEPPMQLKAPDAERIVHVLPRAGAESIEGNGKRSDADSAHGGLFDAIVIGRGVASEVLLRMQ
jgi:hypothetical protein